MPKAVRCCIVSSIFFVLPIFAFGQDLGSSNGLFRAPDPPTKSTSTTVKKTTAKPKSAAVKSAIIKKETSGRKPKIHSNPSNSAKTVRAQVAKSTATIEQVKTPVRQQIRNDIFIDVGKPTSGNFDELFEKAIEQGNTARDDRSYGVAETAYRRAQSLKPRDSRAIYGLGNIFSDQQRWEESERAYRQAIQLEPNSPEAFIALSFVLTQPAIGTSLSERYTEAEKMVRRALFLDGNNAVGYDQLGVALELRGVIEKETQNAYRKAIELDPNFALAYAHLGRLLVRNGLTNESRAAYRDAIRLATDVPTIVLVAEVMQSQQRFVESEQLLRQALLEDPKNPSGLFLLGRALTIRGSFEEAEKVLKASVDVSPNSFVSYALLGSLYTRQNNFDEAEKTLMRALPVITVNEKRRLSQEFEFIGDGFMRIGRSKDAVRVYHRAVALDGNKSLLKDKLNKAQKS